MLFQLPSQVYWLEQSVAEILQNKSTSSWFFFSIAVLFSGTVSSLAPCSVNLFPITIYYIKNKVKLIQWTNWGFFTLGLYLSTFFLLSLSQSIKQAASIYSSAIPYAVAMLYIGSGLLSLNLISVNLIEIQSQRKAKFMCLGQYLYLLIFGFTVGVSVSPCSTPILVSVLIWINSKASFIEGVYFCSLYALGYTIPIIALINLLDITPVIQKSVIITRRLPSVIGAALITFGTRNLIVL